MKHILFTLSMPNVGSWNGKWTESDTFHARVRSFCGDGSTLRAKKILDEGSFRYDFGDGWTMGVNVLAVTAAEKRKVLAHTKGFCGYDWAIDSIVKYNKIMTERQIEAQQGREG